MQDLAVRPEVEGASRVGLIRKARLALSSALVTVSFVLMGNVSAANATTVDPLDGAGDGIFTTLSGYLTTKLIPAVLALAVIGIGVGLLIKYVRKARSAA
jgi:type IV secretory pathway VirB2 component (pilin)